MSMKYQLTPTYGSFKTHSSATPWWLFKNDNNSQQISVSSNSIFCFQCFKRETPNGRNQIACISSCVCVCVCVCVRVCVFVFQRVLRSAGGSAVLLQVRSRRTGEGLCRTAGSVPVVCRTTVWIQITTATVTLTTTSGTVLYY